MPISYRLIDNLLLFKAEGDVTITQFYRVWGETTSDPSFQVPLNTLIDLREAHIDVPSHEIENIVYHLKRNHLFNKIALVAERESFSYAMGRMFCINAENIGCCSDIFINVAEALAWLGNESDEGPPPVNQRAPIET